MSRQKSQHVDDPREVGRRLKEGRERAGLSQRQLSFGGCSPAYISRIEAGGRTPSLQLLRELGRRLGVSADYLATGKEATSASSPQLVEAEVALRLDDRGTARRLYDAALSGELDKSSRAEALAGLGQLAMREGRLRDAIALFEDALEADGSDPVERPGLADSLARAYGALGELAPAIALLRRCVDRYASTDDRIQYIRFASMLGCALTDTADFSAAEQILADALERGREVLDPYTRARLYWSQSRLLAEQGQAASAERYARKTLETLRATEDGYAVAHALETLAHICLDLGRATEARELLEEGEPLIQASGSPTEIAHYRLEKARALAAVGASDEATSLAMEIAGQLRDVQAVSSARAYLLLAELFDNLGESARAEELYELTIEQAEADGPNKHLIVAYRRLAALLKARGHRDEALELLERALATQEQLTRSLG